MKKKMKNEFEKELEQYRTNIISLKVYDVKYSMNSKKN